MSFDQIAIGLLGVTAVFLTQSGERLQRYACLFGMASQPFWFYATFTAGQWGIFALCILYTVAWGRGIHRHWWLRKVVA